MRNSKIPTGTSITKQLEAITFKFDFIVEESEGNYIRVKLRFDDECGNGHNTFAITGNEVVDGMTESSGCIHELITAKAPQFAKYIPYHLMNSDEPMHYIANTLWHSQGRDYNGLLKGETKQLCNGRTGESVWEPAVKNGKGEYVSVGHCDWVDAKERPKSDGNIEYIPVNNIGEGEPINIEVARETAIWPNATLEELRDEGKLKARLPQLQKDFLELMKELKQLETKTKGGM